MRILMIAAMMVALWTAQAHAAKARNAAQVKDIVATVVCGKSEQATPCVLILNKDVPSYELTVKNAGHDLCTIKAEQVKGAWRIRGETRHESFIEVIVDAKDGSYTVFNPRRPDIARSVIPNGCAGLLIRTVEVTRPVS